MRILRAAVLSFALVAVLPACSKSGDLVGRAFECTGMNANYHTMRFTFLDAAMVQCDVYWRNDSGKPESHRLAYKRTEKFIVIESDKIRPYTLEFKGDHLEALPHDIPGVRGSDLLTFKEVK